MRSGTAWCVDAWSWPSLYTTNITGSEVTRRPPDTGTTKASYAEPIAALLITSEREQMRDILRRQLERVRTGQRRGNSL
jgi:hypothetical protein